MFTNCCANENIKQKRRKQCKMQQLIIRSWCTFANFFIFLFSPLHLTTSCLVHVSQGTNKIVSGMNFFLTECILSFWPKIQIKEKKNTPADIAHESPPRSRRRVVKPSRRWRGGLTNPDDDDYGECRLNFFFINIAVCATAAQRSKLRRVGGSFQTRLVIWCHWHLQQLFV